MPAIRSLVEGERINAALAWPLVGFLAFASVEGLLFQSALWGGMAAVLVALALVPTILERDPAVMLPWELLLVATIPFLAREYGVLTQFAGNVAVAVVALVVAVELHVFTSVEMTPRFAVAFVVIATMAVAGIWGIARYASDVAFGTSFVAGNADLMWSLIVATAGGVVAGVAFELYFRRVAPAGAHRRPRLDERRSDEER